MNDLDALITQARRQGWRCEKRGSGHLMLRPPSRAGPLMVISSSPSDYRALAKIRSQLKRAGLILPADHTPPSLKEKSMPRRTTTATKARTVASPDPTLSQADEARLARDQRTLERGEAMAPDARLDRDLAHLADTSPAKRVQSRRRAPEEVGLVYRGKRKGMLTDQYITVIVPDEDNDAAVADKQDVIPGLDEESQRQAWAAEDMRRGVTRPYVRLADRLVLSGPNYTFEMGKTVLVHEDDVAYLLAHDTYRIERAADIEVDDVLPRRRPGYRGS
jgi:hypothetical protein